MSTTTSDPSGSDRRSQHPRAVFAVLSALVLVRMLHLASAMRSPLTYQFGPDEEFHVRFAQALSSGAASDPVFGFMDPLYGYVLAALFAVTGFNIFAVYLVQVAVDALAAYGLILIAREFDRERAGIVAAALYALCLPATLYATTLLKATWVAALLVLWVWLALRALRHDRWGWWVGLGLLGGLGVALRGNLLLLALAGLLLVPLLAQGRGGILAPAARAAWMLGGLALPLALLSLRNAELSGTFSPLPGNGGIVLHQLYNPDNPRSEQYAPAFVSMLHPIEIWQGYRAQAQRRLGRPLSGAQVDRYWRAQALEFITAHPAQVAGNLARKAGKFAAFPEVPNNRSLADEREFSPTLRLLPASFGWLFALGIPGLVVLTWRDRRGWLVVLPLAVVAATFVVFFAESRFRFHGVALFAFAAGYFLDQVWRWARARSVRPLAFGGVAVAVLVALAFWQSQGVSLPGPNWHRIALGQIKSGEPEQARASLQRLLADGESAGAHELQAYFALTERRIDDAITHYRAGIALQPGQHVLHLNLARTLLRKGDHEAALEPAIQAAKLAPTAENLFVLADAYERNGEPGTAASVYRTVLAGGARAADAVALEHARSQLQRLQAPEAR
ncbi:MAG TPA: glycosyltransferase family 39 protein [Xanthomonadaceae bacterium]|nr:glycosyltransferase family 39 protein [Xanthomonadaceae bacterium]